MIWSLFFIMYMVGVGISCGIVQILFDDFNDFILVVSIFWPLTSLVAVPWLFVIYVSNVFGKKKDG